MEGIGEYHGLEPQETIDQYVGTNPFDCAPPPPPPGLAPPRGDGRGLTRGAGVGDVVSLPMGMAMYDLMGKIAGVPCWKLFGPMARRCALTAVFPHTTLSPR